MAARTGIQWCDSTANYWEGCTKVSTEENGGGGCDRPLCAQHAKQVGADEHLCPEHAAARAANTPELF